MLIISSKILIPISLKSYDYVWNMKGLHQQVAKIWEFENKSSISIPRYINEYGDW